MYKYVGLIEVALLVFCLVDCIQSDSASVRNLPKVAWIVLIVLLPVVGSIAWLVAGRPSAAVDSRATSKVPWPSRGTSGFPEYQRPPAPRGPDDDPDFLQQIDSVDREHERTLHQWEEDLRARERRLRDEPTDPSPDPDSTDRP